MSTPHVFNLRHRLLTFANGPLLLNVKEGLQREYLLGVLCRTSRFWEHGKNGTTKHYMQIKSMF